MSSFEVTFPGGLRVDVSAHGHTIQTDQPAPFGSDTAMAPFDVFLASLAACAGFYALRFCQERSLSTEGLGVTLAALRAPEGKRVETIRIELRTPAGFPEKYHQAIVRAIDHCAVKRAIMEPPKFEIEVSPALVSHV
jgi:ribosomal protein S12 methylthiotransferase accessory factor